MWRSAAPDFTTAPSKITADCDRSSIDVDQRACEVSVIERRKFRFTIDEVPNFALDIMGAMARRIRGMGQAMRLPPAGEGDMRGQFAD